MTIPDEPAAPPDAAVADTAAADTAAADAAAGEAAAGDAETVRSAFDAMPTIMAVMEGPENRLVAANRGWRDLVHRPYLGQPAREVMPDISGQRLFELIDRVRDSGEPAEAREWRIQMEVSGQPVDVYMDFTLTPWRWPDGSVRGVLVTQADVTDRVRQRQAAQRRADKAEQRYRAARDIVLELQAALLPLDLPVLPAADVAARYLVAAEDQGAGGDWFSATPLADGRLALVLGDVVGHGVVASSAMGQLRTILDEVLRESGDLEMALRWTDQVAGRSPTMRAATVCVVVLDPLSGDLTYTTCGHPPPLVASAGGSRYLRTTGGRPLGTGSAPSIATEVLGADETLLLYNDGLVERAGVPLEQRMAALARIASDAVANRVMPAGAPECAADRACQLTVELLTREGFEDDVTLLAAHRREPTGPVRLDASADTTGFTEVVGSTRDWLRDAGASSRDQDAVELAVSELVANAVEHAYPIGRPGRVRVALDLDPDGTLRLEVADDGVWVRPGRGPSRVTGRGLWMVGSVLDDLTIEHEGTPAATGVPSDGTVVTARHQLHHTAVLGAVDAHATKGDGMPFQATLTEGPPRTLTLTGSLDVTSAAEFTETFGNATRGGMHQVVLDLSDLQVLASAGVRALFAERDELATHGHPLLITASPGGVAADVLDLVGLEYSEVTPDA